MVKERITVSPLPLALNIGVGFAAGTSREVSLTPPPQFSEPDVSLLLPPTTAYNQLVNTPWSGPNRDFAQWSRVPPSAENQPPATETDISALDGLMIAVFGKGSISRRALLVGSLRVAGILAVGALSACGGGSDAPRTVPTNAPIPTLNYDQLLSAWQNLDPNTRIDKLELGETPSLPDFNQRNELVKATAEFFCQTIGCKITPEELAQKVEYLPTEEFIARSKADFESNGYVWTEELEEKHRNEAIEFVTFDKGKILMHVGKLDDYLTGEATFLQQNYSSELNGRDPKLIIERAILFHAYAHTLETDSEVEITNFISDNVTIKKLKGFKFVGTSAGGSSVSIYGLTEAAAEVIADIVNGYVGLNYKGPAYIKESNLLINILKAANIKPGSFLSVFRGDVSMISLLRDIAKLKDPSNPNPDDAVNALFTVALLSAKGDQFEQEAYRLVNTYLGTALDPSKTP